jgi:hypothetical protein
MYGFNDEELNFLIKSHPSILKPEYVVLDDLSSFWKSTYDLSDEEFKKLVLRFPRTLGTSQEKVKKVFNYFGPHLSQREIVDQILECPKLLDLPDNFEQISQAFSQTYGYNLEELVEIFKVFPYLYCLDIEKLPLFLEQFEKLKFTKEELNRVLSRAGGILASPKTALTGIFNTVKNIAGVSNTNFKQLVVHFPELLLLGRHALFVKKYLLI